MKCVACGKTIPNGSGFCNRCGQSQSSYIPKIEEVLKTKNQRRAGGTGSVYKRGDTWTAKVRKAKEQEPMSNGNVKYATKTKGGFKTRTEALMFLPELYNKLIAETTGLPKEKQGLTMAYYWATYETESLCKLSKAKQVNYRTAYSRLAPLHSRLMKTITVADLRTIVSETCQTYYPARDMKTLLAKLFSLAAADGVANRDLPSFIELPEKEEKDQDAFTPEEAVRIYSQWNSGNFFAGYILLMMTTSMMPGELYGLRKDMIDMEGHKIIGAGIKTKQRKKQSIVFPDMMAPILQKLMDETPGDMVLTPMSDFTFRKHYYKVLEAAGCRKLTPYACRHTTGTTLYLDATLSEAEAARVMRHSARSGETYTHASDDVAKNTVEHVTKIFRGSAAE